MNHIKTKKLFHTLKILSALALSFLIVSFIAPYIFVDNTAIVKPRIQAALRFVPYAVYAYVRHPLNQEERTKIIELAHLQQLPVNTDLSYQPVAKGVHAAEDPITNTVHVRVDKGTQIEVKTITFSDGQTLKIFVPVK